MKSLLMKIGVVMISLLWLSMGNEALAKSPPVAMLTQVKGTIHYSKNGETWKIVRRNMFLFEGYLVRTGSDGSATLVNQETNMSRNVGHDTEFKVSDKGGELLSGHLSEPAQASSSLAASLNQRFAKAQRYTTTRRGAGKNKKMKLATIKSVTLSDAHPDLVWQGMGSEISYRITIDNIAHDVPSVHGGVVRFTVPNLVPGRHYYHVALIKDGEILYSPEKDSQITWLGGEALAAFDQGVKEVAEAAPGDEFLLANYLDEKGLTVAAMDTYAKYFAENPDDIDMYPMLIKSYHDLKLEDLRKAEAVRYNMLLDEEG